MVIKIEIINAKLEILRNLTNDTIANGRTEWSNQTILSWIDNQKMKINEELGYDK